MAFGLTRTTTTLDHALGLTRTTTTLDHALGINPDNNYTGPCSLD